MLFWLSWATHITLESSIQLNIQLFSLLRQLSGWLSKLDLIKAKDSKLAKCKSTHQEQGKKIIYFLNGELTVTYIVSLVPGFLYAFTQSRCRQNRDFSFLLGAIWAQIGKETCRVKEAQERLPGIGRLKLQGNTRNCGKGQTAHTRSPRWWQKFPTAIEKWDASQMQFGRLVIWVKQTMDARTSLQISRARQWYIYSLYYNWHFLCLWNLGN